MKPTTLLSSLLLLQAPLLARADILAGPITNPANGHVYYLLTQNTWTASEAEARTLGGHLVTINDAAENQWVFTTFSSFGDTNRNLWIGLTDTQQSGQFVWASGEAVTYQNWSPTEPNFIGQEHYVSMYPSGLPGGRVAGAWNNYYDASELASFGPLHGVVEIDSLRVDIRVASVAIRWNSESNKFYQVQYATALAPTTWLDLDDPVQGTGTNNIVVDSALDIPRRFYRVVALP